MRGEMGDSWESRYGEFQTIPFAAASIGQVHHATLRDGTKVGLQGVYVIIFSDVIFVSIDNGHDEAPQILFLPLFTP